MIYISALLVIIILLLTTVSVHYFVLRLLTPFINNVGSEPRTVITIVVALFFAHSIEILIYASFYHLAGDYPMLGGFSEQSTNDFSTAIFLSLLAFSSLGISEFYLTGSLRLVVGFEALNGLLLIAWSASFTFMAMGKLWNCSNCETIIMEVQSKYKHH